MCSLFSTLPSFDFCENVNVGTAVVCKGIQLMFGGVNIILEGLFGKLDQDLFRVFLSLIEKEANIKVGIQSTHTVNNFMLCIGQP